MSDINVTPFVDVMLVLLIVFMVSAPLLTVGVPVELPQSQANALTDPDEPIVVTMNGEGKIFVQETEVELERVVPLLQAVSENNPDIRVFVRGDKSLPYGDVMQVMGVINTAGFRHVALVTETPTRKPANP
jgi:biopolymer transport protein TolR